MENQFLISPQGDKLTILHGNALELRHPERLIIVGQIESVRKYLDARRGVLLSSDSLQHINRDLAVITVNEDEGNIILTVDPNNPFTTSVKGELKANPELAPFQINKAHRFTRETFLDLIAFRRRFFSEVSEWDNLKTKFQRLKITSNSEVDQGSDKRGNRDNNFKKEVNSDEVPASFKLEMPIFKGQPPRKFQVDICVDVTDAGVRFFLESADFIELMELDKKKIISDQLQSYLDYCIIWK